MFENYKKLFIFDTETTGFSVENDEIIEVGGLLLERNEESDKFVQIKAVSNLIKTNLSIMNSNIHHITNRMCDKDGIPKEEMYDILKDIFGNKDVLIIAYNAPFDIKFINAFMSKFDKNYCLVNDTLDLLEVAKDRTGLRNGNKLCDMLVRYEVTEEKNSHRALDDVKATLAVMRKMYLEKPDLERYIKKN